MRQRIKAGSLDELYKLIEKTPGVYSVGSLDKIQGGYSTIIWTK